MRLSQMDGRARYSPEFGDSDMTVDNAPFSPDSTARGSGAFCFPDLNDSPDLRHTQGHVTDGTGLPRDLFPGDGRRTQQVFGSGSGVSMGHDEVRFLSFYVLCASYTLAATQSL